MRQASLAVVRRLLRRIGLYAGSVGNASDAARIPAQPGGAKKRLKGAPKFAGRRVWINGVLGEVDSFALEDAKGGRRSQCDVVYI